MIFRYNRNLFGYVIGELVDNIYQHSEFGYALVMAQRYMEKGFIELGFIDDGITIPGSFNKHGYPYTEDNHHQAIVDAMKGLSTKKGIQRGYGLGTSVSMFLALGGQVLVVSGSGAVYLDERNRQSYHLTSYSKMEGTLVGLRVEDSKKKVDIYQFLE